MSRAQRRASMGKARSRRIPVSPTAKRRLGIPWVLLAVIGGVAGVIGLMAYVVSQSNQPPGDPANSKAAKVEADADPSLPGEYVNLPKIFGGFYGNPDGENTAAHVTRSVDYTDEGLPPVGGPHWGSSSCGEDPESAPAFCGPAPWGIFRQPWDPSTLIHNMEHSGVVIWYNTANQETIDDLEAYAKKKLKGGKHLVLTPNPEMDAETVAITVWSRRDKIPVSEYNRKRLDEFIGKLYCRFNPEDFC